MELHEGYLKYKPYLSALTSSGCCGSTGTGSSLWNSAATCRGGVARGFQDGARWNCVWMWLAGQPPTYAADVLLYTCVNRFSPLKPNAASNVRSIHAGKPGTRARFKARMGAIELKSGVFSIYPFVAF